MSDEHDHRHGANNCPVCRRHDHSNSTSYAIDRHGHPVPGWWFTCPKCGSQDAQHFAEQGWTKDGIAYMRANTNGAA